MSIKYYAASAVAVFLCGASLAAQASPLFIMNNTHSDSTIRVHNKSGKCSNELLGEGGITRAGKSNTVSEGSLRLACFSTPSSCVADVYASDHCGGDIIATMTFSVTDGVKNIAMNSAKYHITGNGFHVVLDEVN